MIELLMSKPTFVEPKTTAALLFRKSIEAEMFRSIHEPTDTSEILNTWPRTEGKTLFNDPSTATGESADWNNTGGLFVQPNNASKTLTLLSPVKTTSYVFESVLSSDNADDDAIGLVAAMEENTDGSPILLIVWVSAGGVGTDTFSMSYFDKDSTTNSGDLIDSNNTIRDFETGSGASPEGWSGREVKVKVSRSGDDISAVCTDWDGTEYLEGTEIVVNLNSLPRDGGMLSGPSRYGFATISQANSKYIGHTIRSQEIEDDSRVYSEEGNERWVYSGGTWTNTGDAFSDLSSADLVVNRKTKETFSVDSSITFKSNSGVDYGTVDISVASDPEDIPLNTITGEYATPDLSVTGVFKEDGLTATLNTNDITVSATSNGSFYVLLETPSDIDPETNIEEKTIAFRKVNITV